MVLKSFINLRQQVLSHPVGKASKLICPPIEYVIFNSGSFSLTAATNFSLTLWTLSYLLNSSLSSWLPATFKYQSRFVLQFLPTGDTLIIPFRYSINVPLTFFSLLRLFLPLKRDIQICNIMQTEIDELLKPFFPDFIANTLNNIFFL